MRSGRFVASVLDRALRNMWEQRRLHLLALSVMALSLSVVGAFAMVASNLARVRAALGAERVITAFIGAGVDAAGQQRLRGEAAALPGVARVELLAVEEARDRFREALGPHGALLDGLSGDVIPAALVVVAQAEAAPDQMAALAKRLAALVGVEEVAYAAEELERLTTLIRAVELIALAVGALIALVTVIVVSNTIRLTVLARQEEIAIMKLVGATDSFVRLPFVVEGLLGGLAAGAIAIAIVWSLNAAVLGAIGAVAAGALDPIFAVRLSALHASLLVGGGGLLGLVGGLVSVGRFLKVM
ncbi:MAG: hypothetical protein JXR83_20935 [Deltaproteobacteria bacterium]|nr:hypothetical protein [Deltaproteobacteria bacterium]